MERRDVIVIGAGPSGAIASALLKRRGWDVVVLEAQRFPRFSIGESLLAHCLDFVEEAGMLPAVEAAGFQFKNGAAFVRGEEYGEFDFDDKFTPGRNSTFQVERAKFDKLLADEAAKQGVDVRYEVRVGAVTAGAEPRVHAIEAGGREYDIAGRFILDASGFGRTLPKLLQLETPSNFPVRNAVFTHVADRIPDGAFDRNKIQVVVHPQHNDVWYWLIPFPQGPLLARLRREQGVFRDAARRSRRAPAPAGQRGAVPRAVAGERGMGHADARAVRVRRQRADDAR